MLRSPHSLPFRFDDPRLINPALRGSGLAPRTPFVLSTPHHAAVAGPGEDPQQAYVSELLQALELRSQEVAELHAALEQTLAGQSSGDCDGCP